MNELRSSAPDYLRPAFRIALFAVAVSLAGYIVFQYTVREHASEGFYAAMFPLSSLLALAGIVLALKPSVGCRCNTGIRLGLGALSIAWIATGLACTPELLAWIAAAPFRGGFATLQMLAQHVFLSLGVLAFMAAPGRVVAWIEGDIAHPKGQTATHAS